MATPSKPTVNRPSTASQTSITLLERVKNQQEDAWEDLVHLYAPLVYRLCRVAGLATHDASDVVQEVFRAVSRNIGRFHRDRPGDSFRAWLLTITKNKIRDHFRQKAKHPAAVGGTDMQVMIQQVPELTWESSTDGSQFDSDSDLMRRAIRLVKNDFAESTWRAFWSVTIEGQSPEAVAEQLGISKWSVYQAKSRVLGRIRDELQGLLEPSP